MSYSGFRKLKGRATGVKAKCKNEPAIARKAMKALGKASCARRPGEGMPRA